MYYLFISILHIAVIAPIIIAIYYFNNKINNLDSTIKNDKNTTGTGSIERYKNMLNSSILILLLFGLWGAIYHIISVYNIYNL